MHAHNDLGLATTNTLAAVKAGATHINTTVNGPIKNSANYQNSDPTEVGRSHRLVLGKRSGNRAVSACL